MPVKASRGAELGPWGSDSRGGCMGLVGRQEQQEEEEEEEEEEGTCGGNNYSRHRDKYHYYQPVMRFINRFEANIGRLGKMTLCSSSHGSLRVACT